MEPDFTLAAMRNYRFANGVIPPKGLLRGARYPANIMVFVQIGARVFRQTITGDAMHEWEEKYETRVCRKGVTLDGAYTRACEQYPAYWVVKFATYDEYLDMGGRCRIGGAVYAASMREAIARIR